MPDIRDFTLPDLGEGLEEGEIVEWHVEVGDLVELNQPVADIETAKAVVAVPSPFAGRVVERIGEAGETLAVGSVFLRIDTDPDDAGAEVAAGAQPHDESHAEHEQDEEEPQPLVGYGQGRAGTTRRRRRRRGAAPEGTPQGDGQLATRVLAKPPVRKLAKDLGVDLAAIAPGSGPDGIITRQDVTAAADEGAAPAASAAPAAPSVAPSLEPEAPTPEAEPSVPAPQPAAPSPAAVTAGEKPVPGFRGRRPGEVEPIRGIRRRIVEKMEVSRREIPSATCSRDADLTELWELRKRLTEQAREDGFDVKITPFALVMRATVLALRRFPTLNARIDRQQGEIHLLEHVNLGFAADTDRGLVVPNIKDAHIRSTLELAVALAELAGKARDGTITPDELTGGTFTVNNYGAFGNDDGDPIINHPEGAILGIAAIRERPWVVDGELAVRRVARFTLAFDHRICDGGEAGRFVTYVADLCEEPSRILLHS